MKTLEEVRAALTGPIPSIRTPFTRDGNIDYNALRRMIDFDIDAGAKAIVLTAGDSHLIVMSDQEIAELTKATAEHVAGRALVVAADRYFDTKQSVAFGQYAAGVGADVLMVLPPDWAASTSPATLAQHYAAVGEHIPVMMVTNLFIARGPEFGLATIREVIATGANVVAVKDDVCGTFARRLCIEAHDHMAIWAGGYKENHVNMAPYGIDGFLSTFITFHPKVARQYWDAYTRGDLAESYRIIREIEMPFFNFIRTIAHDQDAALHGMLEVKGLAERWRPRPYHSMTDEELEKLAGYMQEHGFLS